mgnify:CR=1 FL=1
MLRSLKYLIIFALSLVMVSSLMVLMPQGKNPATITVSPTVVSPRIIAENSGSEPLDGSQLVDIQMINPRIVLEIRYATPHNFFRRQLYQTSRCILRREVAEQLSQVQIDLEQQGLGLKVFDCYRPLSVTQQMWELLPDPRYVANPARGSRHNRGAAVDLTLVDQDGNDLKMPTDFDDFTEKAGRDYQGNSSEVQSNSDLLSQVMQKHGFMPLVFEWWHFDLVDWEKFPILDLPFESVPAPGLSFSKFLQIDGTLG